MQRNMVQVTQVRMRDVLPGDIVNRNYEEARGWVKVVEVLPLPNNQIVLAASSDRDSVNGSINDIVGIQVVRVVEVPDAPQEEDQEQEEEQAA